MPIDITITATCRPGILRRTLETFSKYMLRPKSNIGYKVFINVDPLGPGTQWETIKVCFDYFDEADVIYHIPRKPSFPKAFMWVWREASNSNSPYVLHLEDDWELLRPVDIEKLLILLHLHSDLAILRLSAFPSKMQTCKNWDKYLNWNGTFFEVPPDLRGLLGFAGHPSLICKEFVRTILPCMDDDINPEKQIKGNNRHCGGYIKAHRYGVYIEQNAPPLIKDIGRAWMLKTGYRKRGSKAWFTEWEKPEKEEV